MRALSFEQALDGPFAEAMSDFDSSAWRPFLRSLDGHAPLPDQQAIFEQCTGRTEPFLQPPRTAQATCGRRSGKTRVGALLCATAASFWDHTTYLAKGERARILLLSQSKDQATVARGYVLALLESNEVTAALIESVTAEVISLRNGVDLVVTAASYRGVRGFSCPLILADETSMWRDSETSTNPAKEIFRALAPGMASVPQPLMLSISTPWSKEGAHYETHAKHFGDDQSRVLVWQASSATMNPTLDPQVIEDAFADDPEAARAEYGGEFRSDVSSFIDRDTVSDCIDERGRTERGRMSGATYFAFTDSAGGSGKDAYTLAIAHAEGDVAVLDVLVEIRPPFNPSLTTGELSKVLHRYGCWQVTGDRYAGGWVPAEFRKHGITYAYSARDRSEVYLSALPLFNTARVRLLDNLKLVNQISSLQRHTGSSGKQRVDHPKNGHDDLANAACGAIVLAAATDGVRIVRHEPVQISQRADPALGIVSHAVNPACVSSMLSEPPGYARFDIPDHW